MTFTVSDTFFANKAFPMGEFADILLFDKSASVSETKVYVKIEPVLTFFIVTVEYNKTLSVSSLESS